MPNILSWAPGQLDLSTWASEWANPPYRSLTMSDGTEIRAQVTVVEDGDDDLIITEHPVEQGAVIHDHAFKRPAELRMQLGWSGAFAYDQGVSVRQIYEQILSLQASRLPFTVFTGKRVYQNMLIASLRTHTDAQHEFDFLADIAFKEVILVNTSVITVSGASYNQQSLADPQSNAANLPTGQVQPVQVNLPDNQVAAGTGHDLAAA